MFQSQKFRFSNHFNIDLAEKECTIKYEVIESAYDPDEEVWKIQFCTEIDKDEGSEIVFINKEGKTLLCVQNK